MFVQSKSNMFDKHEKEDANGRYGYMAIRWKMRGYNDRRLSSKACCSGNLGNTVTRDHDYYADTIRIHAMPSIDIDRRRMVYLPNQN